MYALGKEFLLAIKAKISIKFIIHVQEKYILPKIFWLISSTYIIRKFSMIEIIQTMIRRKL